MCGQTRLASKLRPVGLQLYFNLKPAKTKATSVISSVRKETPVAYDVDSEDDVLTAEHEPFLRDLAVMGPSSQLRYDEARAFRTLCFNDPERWTNLAGRYCALEAVSTARNVLMLVPEGLQTLPAFSALNLTSLLHGQFGVVKFAVRFAVGGKKNDPFHLGLLLTSEEAFFKVHNVREVLQRFVIILGSIFGDELFYRNLFEDLLNILCSSRHPISMSSWSTAYVFKWLSQKLFKFGYHLGQEKSSFFSKNKLFRVLKKELDFTFSVEQGMYLMSEEFKSWNSPRVAAQPRPFNHPTTVPARPFANLSPPPGPTLGTRGLSNPLNFSVSANPLTPKDQQWCLPHASHALGVSVNPCKGDLRGGPCNRVHPVLTRPLSDPQKTKLTSLAEVIRKPDFKSKFLAAIV